jgi:DNA-binding CsgD family transcriptional regulator
MTRVSNMITTAVDLDNHTALTFLSRDARIALMNVLRLSPREAMIVELVVTDLHEDLIASTLGISKHTVHTHLDRIYRKVGAHSRCQLAVKLFSTYVTMVGSRIIVTAPAMVP